MHCGVDDKGTQECPRGAHAPGSRKETQGSLGYLSDARGVADPTLSTRISDGSAPVTRAGLRCGPSRAARARSVG